MHRNIFILLSFLLPFSFLFGQEGKVFTIEVFVCDSTARPIKDVAVYDTKNNLRSVTNREGMARVATRQGETLYFSHLGFDRKTFRVDKRTLAEVGEIKNVAIVTLRAKSNLLPEISVIEHAPHLAYENKEVWVSDYKVGENGMFLILHKPFEHVLLYVNHDQDTLAQLKIKRKFDELYQDVFGNMHLLSLDSAYQVYCNGQNLYLLYGNKKENFNAKLKPIVAATTDVIVKEERYAYGQQIKVYYIVVDRATKTQKVMRRISSSTMEMALNWERDNQRFLLANNHKDNTLFCNLREDLPEDQLDFMFNVKKRLMLQPVYNPIFVLHNAVFVFDFENGFLCHFDKSGALEQQYAIDFHKQKGTFGIEKKREGWDKNIIMDQATGRCYAQFTTDGIVTLKEIDLESGKVKREIRLTDHSFPQNIQVYNGDVYYLYLDKRRVVDKDKRSLYKMKLE